MKVMVFFDAGVIVSVSIKTSNIPRHFLVVNFAITK